MLRMLNRTALPVLVLFALAGSASADQTAAQLEAEAMRTQAQGIQRQLSGLLADPEAMQRQETVELMRKMLDQLTQINEKLTKLLAGQEKPKPPAQAPNPASLQWSGFSQFQWFESNQRNNAGALVNQQTFQIPRLRIQALSNLDARTRFRVSFEASAGQDQNGFDLRDVEMSYRLDRTLTLAAGQFIPAIGQDLPRGPSVREMPEQTLATRAYFSRERNKGATLTYVNGPWTAWAGAFNSLSIGDPEQAGRPVVNETAGAVGVRYTQSGASIGASYFAGRRPELAGGGSTPANRRFLVVDASKEGLLDRRLTVRGEVMWAHDRVPSTTPSLNDGTNQTQWIGLLRWDLSSLDHVFTRYAVWDRDIESNGNAVSQFALGYRRNFTPNHSLILAREWFDDNALGAWSRWGSTTVRWQFRF